MSFLYLVQAAVYWLFVAGSDESEDASASVAMAAGHDAKVRMLCVSHQCQLLHHSQCAMSNDQLSQSCRWHLLVHGQTGKNRRSWSPHIC